MKSAFALVLVIALCLGCSGCAWMDGSYVSITPHQLGFSQSSEDVPVVSGYAGLRNMLTALVDSCDAKGLCYLSGYSQEDAESDVQAVISYICRSYPIGAYAVESIEYAFGVSSGQNALSLDITYRHTRSEIDKIRTVRGISGAKRAIAEALDGCRDSLVLQITGYEETDFVQLIGDYTAGHPDVVMELPQTSVQVYPEQGDVRIVELLFAYQTSRDSLRQMQNQVEPIFSSAKLYVSSDAEARTKFSQLYTFLMERSDYTIETSITPAYSLLRHGVGDSKAFAQIYAAMCRQVGLECLSVSGTYNGESRFWNIILENDTYFHVDLLDCARVGYFRTLTDEQMSGYVWDYSAYPVCGIPIENPEE